MPTARLTRCVHRPSPPFRRPREATGEFPSCTRGKVQARDWFQIGERESVFLLRLCCCRADCTTSARSRLARCAFQWWIRRCWCRWLPFWTAICFAQRWLRPRRVLFLRKLLHGRRAALLLHLSRLRRRSTPLVLWPLRMTLHRRSGGDDHRVASAARRSVLAP